ncbi:MAG TPA: hypothetical protein VGQ39_06230 [Pyrinomonadaceae bacterium]|jgi:hypothetical protein|nr:hypothetical protein [Pyrinomonadaceae bacterium]
MNKAFKVIDLVSQGRAVQSLVRGWPEEQIIEWLRHQGQLESLPEFNGNKAYSFRSPTGIAAAFFLIDDEFTFIGDNALFRPR